MATCARDGWPVAPLRLTAIHNSGEQYCSSYDWPSCAAHRNWLRLSCSVWFDAFSAADRDTLLNPCIDFLLHPGACAPGKLDGRRKCAQLNRTINAGPREPANALYCLEFDEVWLGEAWLSSPFFRLTVYDDPLALVSLSGARALVDAADLVPDRCCTSAAVASWRLRPQDRRCGTRQYRHGTRQPACHAGDAAHLADRIVRLVIATRWPVAPLKAVPILDARGGRLPNYRAALPRVDTHATFMTRSHSTAPSGRSTKVRSDRTNCSGVTPT